MFTSHASSRPLRQLGVHGLLEVDAELFSDAIEFLNVLIVLALVLHLCLDSYQRR